MNVVRIRMRLDLPIPQLPELAPLIGKDVEIVAREQPTAEGLGTLTPFSDLKGGWPEDQLNDGFEEEVDRWRREQWRSTGASSGSSGED